VKCRPPNNRKPTYPEQQACREHWEREVEEVNPQKILALGQTAAMVLKGSRYPPLFGRMFKYDNIPVWPVYHPAYIAYRPSRYDDVLKIYKKALEVSK